MRLPVDIREYFRKEGAKGGKIGGKARLTTMTAEARSEVAKKGAAARWAKKAVVTPKKKPARPNDAVSD